MILLDFLFNICYAPFLNVNRNGRLAAVIWLTPSLTFTLMGVFIFVFHLTIGRVILVLKPLGLGIFSILLFVLIFVFLDRTYLKGARNAGEIRFPILHGLLLPVFVIGSFVFFALVAYRLG